MDGVVLATVRPRPREAEMASKGDIGKRAGDSRFHALLTELGELHDLKQTDYGADTDPFANVRASQEWGVRPWVGALVRLNDKVHRLKQFARRGFLANESAVDSLKDIAVYALIALILLKEEQYAAKPDVDLTD